MSDELTTSPKPPILVLHGAFGRPLLLARWTRFLEAAGCAAPPVLDWLRRNVT